MTKDEVLGVINECVHTHNGRPLKYNQLLKNSLLPKVRMVAVMQMLANKFPNLIFMENDHMVRDITDISRLPVSLIIALCRKSEHFVPPEEGV